MLDRAESPPLFAPLDNISRKLPPAAVRQAAQWMARVQCDDEPGAADACLRWRSAHPDHECAWQRMNALTRDLTATTTYSDPRIVASALDGAAARDSRRKAIKLALGAAGLIAVGWRMADSLGPVWLAEHRTGTGERRALTLADGTQVVLNTNSAIDVTLTASQRQVWLRQGEILVTTSPDPQGRPFFVRTISGSLQPIGTRFTVRQFDDDSHHVRVAVLQGAVQVQPRAAVDTTALTTVHAGEATCFDANTVQPIQHLVTPNAEAAWDQGMMVATRMPLSDFASELARYRSGVVRCEAQAAKLSVTGAFPINNTDATLRMLTEVLPVQIVYRTRYWVSIRSA